MKIQDLKDNQRVRARTGKAGEESVNWDVNWDPCADEIEEPVQRAIKEIQKTDTGTNDLTLIEEKDLKIAINNLLWTYLPDSITLRKAEELSCKIYDLIQKEWEIV